ncbi:MAG TPA: endonuclease III [Myxococcota bacterium]|nr:endonuclease III [Myxococcota bacterium]
MPTRATSNPRPSRATKARARKIGALLDELFPDPAIPLDHLDPFTFLCAVLLSAQTTDKKVNEVTPALFERAPTPAAMAAMDVAEIQHLIREIGLAPTKAKHLKAMATLLVERHGGEVPRTFEELESLPGVGHKTASVLMSQCFGVPAFPIDTHIHRLAARWSLSEAKNVEQTERDLKALFPEEEWNRRHLQIIYFGRAFCPARGHDPTVCPICSFCPPVPQASEEPGTGLKASGSAGRPRARGRS